MTMEKAREIWHRKETLKEWDHPLQKIEQKIVHLNPNIEKRKFQVKFTKNLKFGDIQTNYPQVFRSSPAFHTVEQFVDYLKNYIPNEKIELLNGLMNIYLPREFFTNSIKRIIEYRF